MGGKERWGSGWGAGALVAISFIIASIRANCGPWRRRWSSVSANLAERFGIPPFSVFEARKGWWQDRKRAWLDLGIRSELGRGAAPGGAPRPLDRGWSGEKSFPAVPGRLKPPASAPRWCRSARAICRSCNLAPGNTAATPAPA